MKSVPITIDQELPQFQHHCPMDGAHVNEFHLAILDCRCYQSAEFLAAQDRVAVALDAQRKTKDQ